VYQVINKITPYEERLEMDIKHQALKSLIRELNPGKLHNASLRATNGWA